MTEQQHNPAERDDELLSAYLDDELPQDDADALTERLAREPALMQRLQALRAADDEARAMFSRIDEEPLPQAILDMLQDSDTTTHEKDNVVPFPQRIARQLLQAPVAIAASVALAAGFLADRMLLEGPADAQGIEALVAQQIAPDSEVYELLENGVSTATLVLQDGSEARLLLTFQDQDGDWCRQLSVAQDARQLQALACRRNGQWQSEALAFGETASGNYQQASAQTPAAINAAIDRVIGGNQPLDVSAEAALVERGWKK